MVEENIGLPATQQRGAKTTKMKTGEEQGKNEAELIGFHKGSLTTLAKERQELLRILTIVEQLMQMHVKELKKLGVDLEEEAKKIKEKGEKGNKAIDELVK